MTKTKPRSGDIAVPDAGALSATLPVAAPPDAFALLPPDAPSFISAAGRGYSGKTMMLNAIRQRAHNPVLVADADRTNTGLSARCADALIPASTEDADVRDLVMQQLDQVVSQRCYGMLDLGAGDRILPDVAHELRLTTFLTRSGIRPVLIHMLGPDPADLDLLKRLEASDVYSPPATAIFFNTRLLTKGARPDVFQRLIDAEPVLQQAIMRGAHVGVMPTLAPAVAVEALGVSYRDAARGIAPEGQTPLGPTARQLVLLWLEEMETLLAPIAEWLP